MRVELLDYTVDPMYKMGMVANTSYGGNATEDAWEKIAMTCMEKGHDSVMEHVYFTFIVEGISRACSHQLVRHRHISVVQMSQRYTMQDDVDFIIPPSIESDSMTKYDFDILMDCIMEHYNILIDKGVPKEDARFILPNATPTSMTITMNLRTFREIYEKRSDKSAQWEIRELVNIMADIIKSIDSRLMKYA